jgi:signal transduction histidine kinase
VEWAKKQREKTSFDPARLQLRKAVDEALDLLKANAIQKSVKFDIEVADDIYVNADSLMLRSILQNLVTNAIKFTPQGGGIVKINATATNAMVEVCIRDFGIGMSEETKNMLLRNSTSASLLGTDQEKGSGLGLLLVKDFVAQHGGTIAIESELGKGTCFTFTIPEQ